MSVLWNEIFGKGGPVRFMKTHVVLLVCLIAAVAALLAQAPIGTIAGVVTDESGALVPNATVSITNPETGLKRDLLTTGDGSFSAPALAAGRYEVRVTAPGFRVLVRQATVVTGSTTTVDMQLQVGATADVVTVESATAQISYDSHKIDGVVSRRQIDSLPLNGRGFLQLAFLEPGVSVSTGSTSQYNAQFTVSILGGSNSQAAITVDGGNIRDGVNGNSSQNFSQEVVEEFQLSSVNFDLSTGITGTGAVNIVTRSGGNQHHGAGYYLFRDHNMAAYPALNRSAFNPDPFFARRHAGFVIGGPIKKDRLFFFVNFEHTNQDSVVSFQPNSTRFPGLAGNFGSPYTGKQFSARFDYRINTSHNLFARYSHDGNASFGPAGGPQYPSNWLRNTNWSDQSLMGLTSTFTAAMVNDARISYQYWQNRNLFPREEDCPGCVGLGFPQMQIAGTNITIGNTSNATQGRDLRKYGFTDTMTWQQGSHRHRFGFNIEHAPGTGFWGFADPGAGAVWGPDLMVANRIPLALWGLPDVLTTGADVLKLPLYAITLGIGNPGQPPPYNIDKAKSNNRYKFFWQDTWRIKPRFTLNYGLAWQVESTVVNHDIDKGAYLGAILDGTQASKRDTNNFSPALGFAWNVGSDNKTVIRGGAGLYYDTQELWERLQERALIGPFGNGRVPFPGTGVPSPIALASPAPGLPAVNRGTSVLDFRTAPTAFTLGHLMQVMGPVRAGLDQQLSNPNPTSLAIRGVDVFKTGDNIIPVNYPITYSEHFNLGVQRELRRDLVVTADFVFRQFIHTDLSNLDYNRFQRASGPVIRRCTAAETNNPAIACSNGVLTVRTPGGRGNYKALLVRVDKRFANRYQFLASYALQDEMGVNGVQNLDNWFSSWGPSGSRHRLNISAIVDLPWKFQLSFISASASRGPVMPNISAIDLDGDGTNNEPLPGVSYNGFNRGLGRSDLETAINNFNQKYAGTTTPRNQRVPTLAVPASYEFGDLFSSQDLRLTKVFSWGERPWNVKVFGEVFNMFNVANLGGFSFDLTNPTFGRPTSRAGQVFGSGGPRAFQLGARFEF
jgi:carboxypeptidase family protein